MTAGNDLILTLSVSVFWIQLIFGYRVSVLEEMTLLWNPATDNQVRTPAQPCSTSFIRPCIQIHSHFIYFFQNTQKFFFSFCQKLCHWWNTQHNQGCRQSTTTVNAILSLLKYMLLIQCTGDFRPSHHTPAQAAHAWTLSQSETDVRTSL